MDAGAEIVIIGAGVIGSSLAWHLARASKSPDQILVIDFDLEGSLSSSELNAGGVRATFSQPINILASKLSIEFFEKHSSELGFRNCGYLWLVSPESKSSFLKAQKLQVELGWDVQILSHSDLAKKYPFLDKLDGVHSAHFGSRDGLINPNLLKNFYRQKAKELGIRFLDRSQLVGAEYKNAANSWELKIRKFPMVLSSALKEEVLTRPPNQELEGFGALGGIHSIQAKRVVNCAGAWASQVSKFLGYDSLTKPVRRQVCVFDSRDLDLSPYGMMVDTSGVYFHPEASNGMAGIALPSDPEIYSFQYSGEAFFHDEIWPKLYDRSSHFEKLKHLTGWAGLYENSPDHSALIGPVHVPGVTDETVFECHSFSGHGVMHSYAAGLGLSERILSGNYQTIDFTPLDRKRFNSKQWVQEGAVI